MSQDLPPPLTSADCDCTNLDGFMLNVERLMASELVALSSHEVIGAALFLWCRAWKQRPAASLPDDDRVLAAFAKLPVARFKKLRDEILHGFVKCSDGRLYHKFLAGEATTAFGRKTAFRAKRETDSERLKKWRNSHARNADETRIETTGETHIETRFVREGQGQGQGQGHKKERDLIGRECVRVRNEVLQIIGGNPEDPKWHTGIARVEMWLKAGISAENMIFPAMRRYAASPPPGFPHPFPYLEKVVFSYRDELAKPLPEAKNGSIASTNPARPTAEQRIAADLRIIAETCGIAPGGLEPGVHAAGGIILDHDPG